MPDFRYGWMRNEGYVILRLRNTEMINLAFLNISCEVPSKAHLRVEDGEVATGSWCEPTL